MFEHPEGRFVVQAFLWDMVTSVRGNWFFHYFRRSHLSETKLRVIIRSFAPNFPASKIAELSDVSRPTINQLLLKCGAGGKTIVFGILERQGKVYIEIVPDASKKQLQAAIWGQVALDSSIHSEGWRGYNELVDMGYKKHFRVHPSEHEFARGKCHINGIESFWSYAKRRPVKFNGVPRQAFHLHLKECEFRFNHREENLSDRILTLLRENPL